MKVIGSRSSSQAGKCSSHLRLKWEYDCQTAVTASPFQGMVWRHATCMWARERVCVLCSRVICLPSTERQSCFLHANTTLVASKQKMIIMY